MDKQRAHQIVELAARLINLDAGTLSEQQLQQRNDMIFKLKEEIKMLDEASLATMRDYFAGNQDAHDPMDITKQRLHFAKDPNARANMQKRFRSPAEYEAWLKQNGLKQISTVKEFAADDGDSGEEETLHKYARMWYNGNDATQQQVEQVLARMGWEIGELESEEGGAFVVQAGDENGNSYIGFSPADLTEGVTEDADGEYNDEAGMAKSGLQTMSRAVTGLMDTIQEGDNLPEWAQEKLSLAEDYLTTVWDYLLSQKEQGIEPKLEEASQRVDSLVTDALKIMRGPELADAVQALKTVLGDREFSNRRGFYNFFIRQMMDMYKQRGVTETKKPSPKLTPVNIKKSDPVSEEINTEAYERLQKVFAFKNYES